jgi:transposase
MLSFTGAFRVFVALEACDMRKGFERLSGMVATKLNEDLQSGALFVFSNCSIDAVFELMEIRPQSERS